MQKSTLNKYSHLCFFFFSISIMKCVFFCGPNWNHKRSGFGLRAVCLSPLNYLAHNIKIKVICYEKYIIKKTNKKKSISSFCYGPSLMPRRSAVTDGVSVVWCEWRSRWRNILKKTKKYQKMTWIQQQVFLTPSVPMLEEWRTRRQQEVDPDDYDTLFWRRFSY